MSIAIVIAMHEPNMGMAFPENVEAIAMREPNMVIAYALASQFSGITFLVILLFPGMTYSANQTPP